MTDLIEKDLAENGVLTIKMNRPDVLNSLNKPLVDALIAAFNEAETDDAVRSIVLTGNGRGFAPMPIWPMVNGRMKKAGRRAM